MGKMEKKTMSKPFWQFFPIFFGFGRFGDFYGAGGVPKKVRNNHVPQLLMVKMVRQVWGCAV
eukprot:45104-Amphidinium_carterae.1